MSCFASPARFAALLGLASATLAMVPAGAAPLVDHVPPGVVKATAPASVATVGYESVVLDANRIHTTITNFGHFGNNFQNRNPSLEYPPGLGFEHLTHAGLWIGANGADSLGAFIGVTTGAHDQPIGIAPYNLSEFTPITSIGRRSSNPASPYYDPDAVSDMDLVSDYGDSIARAAWGDWGPPRPLGVLVHQETYAWQAASLQDIVFNHIVVRATRPLTFLCVGLYTELASVPKNLYVNWPPSASDPGGMGRWTGKKLVSYDTYLKLMREHYCAAQPLPLGCHFEVVPYSIGVKFFTPPGFPIGVSAWPWGTSAMWSRDDESRYLGLMMSGGNNPDFTADSLAPGTGDPVEMVSIGPFPHLEPGDSLTFDFAFLGSPDNGSLEDRAIMAQQVYDAGYRNATTPTLVSLAEQVVEPGRVRLVWMLATITPGTRVERASGEAWTDLGEPAREGADRLAIEDRDVSIGASYRYRLRLPSGETLGEVAVRIPGAAGFGIAIAGANPAAASAVRVRLAIEPGSEALVEVFDVTGRRVMAAPVAASATGTRELTLGAGQAFAPGVYLARLSQRARAATARFVVLE